MLFILPILLTFGLTIYLIFIRYFYLSYFLALWLLLPWILSQPGLLHNFYDLSLQLYLSQSEQIQ